MSRRNLFYVNTDEVERTLQEANADLVKRSYELIGLAERLPDALNDKKDIEKALEVSKAVASGTKECRASRLSDEQSFKEAIKTVEKFYSAFEKPLKAVHEKLVKTISLAEVKFQRVAATGDEDRVIGTSNTNAPVIVTQSMPSAGSPELEWIVEQVDPKTVDLEKLRPFLSEYVLTQAAKKFLKENGPREIQGVTYGRRIKI